MRIRGHERGYIVVAILLDLNQVLRTRYRATRTNACCWPVAGRLLREPLAQCCTPGGWNAAGGTGRSSVAAVTDGRAALA